MKPETLEEMDGNPFADICLAAGREAAGWEQQQAEDERRMRDDLGRAWARVKRGVYNVEDVNTVEQALRRVM